MNPQFTDVLLCFLYALKTTKQAHIPWEMVSVHAFYIPLWKIANCGDCRYTRGK